jgi:TPR repeat protein
MKFCKHLFLCLALFVASNFLTSCAKMIVASLNSLPKLDEIVQETRQAAEGGEARSQCELGEYYSTGVGVTKDYVEAVKWFRKAAKQGNARAQEKLGLCYAHGLGVSKDHVEAFALLSLAGDTVEKARVNRNKLARIMDVKQLAAAQKREKELRKLYTKSGV